MTKIGVAISTHKRISVLKNSLHYWSFFKPDILVINHDRDGKGVAYTKNQGISALMGAGCTDLFLLDDDIWPINPCWSEMYVNANEQHLMHCWGKSRFMGDDGTYSIWSWPRGVMLYVTADIINAVGGMRLEFGRWGGEHAEWSKRIHAAGLTKYQFADLSIAKLGVWDAYDYTRRIPSTISDEYRQSSAGHRHKMYAKYSGSTDFVEYRNA